MSNLRTAAWLPIGAASFLLVACVVRHVWPLAYLASVLLVLDVIVLMQAYRVRI